MDWMKKPIGNWSVPTTKGFYVIATKPLDPMSGCQILASPNFFLNPTLTKWQGAFFSEITAFFLVQTAVVLGDFAARWTAGSCAKLSGKFEQLIISRVDVWIANAYTLKLTSQKIHIFFKSCSIRSSIFWGCFQIQMPGQQHPQTHQPPAM